MRVTVVGSINHDLRILVPHLPTPGETVGGQNSDRSLGGKGANQAVAAARLGADVCLVAAIGHDGLSLLDELRSNHVDVSSVVRDSEQLTGLAVVLVEPTGENMIVPSPGANSSLRPADLPEELDGVLLLQHEVPANVVEHAVTLGARRVILNPAPYREVPDHVIEHVDILVPNAVELARMLDTTVPGTVEAAARLVSRLRPHGLDVVATLGAQGALVRQAGSVTHLPAVPVQVVDTVGAGDAFCGALACGIADDLSLLDAARFATYASALSVQASGAQGSLPELADVLARAASDGVYPHPARTPLHH